MKTINAMMLSLAALTIAGCSQNEVTEISPDAHPQVGFGVYTGVPTRGVDMTTESMKDDPTDANKYGGFGIMAYFTGQDNFETVKTTVTPSFMHNQMVKFDGTNNVWTYSPVKYWPNRQNDKISFFAYAPYESDWQNGSKSGVITSYQSSTTAIQKLSVGKKTGVKLRAIGAELDPHFLSQNVTRNDGAKAEDWDRIVVKRVKEMGLQSLRVMVMPQWYEPKNDNPDASKIDWHNFTFNSVEMQSLYKVLVGLVFSCFPGRNLLWLTPSPLWGARSRRQGAS